jgi:hypothetical protein
MRLRLDELGIEPGRFGWASIQADGGIAAAQHKIERWFAGAQVDDSAIEPVGLGALRLGLLATVPLPDNAADCLSVLARQVVQAGGSVVVPHNATLLASTRFLDDTLTERAAAPSLAYGQQITAAGFHVMETPTRHWVETLTGLGATGVDVLLAYVGEQSLPGHPLLPLLQIAAAPAINPDADALLAGSSANWPATLLNLLAETASRRYQPRVQAQHIFDFQITRGLLGISL